MIDKITIIGGYDKNGEREPVEEVTIRKGEIVGVVGPTGSGKSSLIGDIEQLAQEDTFPGEKYWLMIKNQVMMTVPIPEKRWLLSYLKI